MADVDVAVDAEMLLLDKAIRDFMAFAGDASARLFFNANNRVLNAHLEHRPRMRSILERYSLPTALLHRALGSRDLERLALAAVLQRLGRPAADRARRLRDRLLRPAPAGGKPCRHHQDRPFLRCRRRPQPRETALSRADRGPRALDRPFSGGRRDRNGDRVPDLPRDRLRLRPRVLHRAPLPRPITPTTRSSRTSTGAIAAIGPKRATNCAPSSTPLRRCRSARR
jgi:hypothetical protein